MNQCRLDSLPVELIYHLLSYFDAHEIFYTFTNVSFYFNSILFTYPYYRINFKSISKSKFDLVCQCIKPEQVISLTLSNDENTPGLVELFLSRFQINQFIYLQSLRLIDVGPDYWQSIMTKLIELKNLRSFFFILSRQNMSWISNISDNDVTQLDINLFDNYAPILPQLYRLRLCHGDFLNSIKFPQLRHLILERSSVDIVKHICSVAPQLKSLETRFKCDDLTTELVFSLPQLKRLVLKIEGVHISMNDIERILSNLPCLKYLDLIANCNNDVINGQRWQIILKHIITFKFLFNLFTGLDSNDLDSFRSSFWLEEKHWYVVYTSKRLFSMSYYGDTYSNEDFEFPEYLTVPDNKTLYEYIDTIDPSEIPDNMEHYFTHVKTLILSFPTVLSTLEKVVNLNRIQHLNFYISMKNFPVMLLINQMPCLHQLLIGCNVRRFLKQVRYKAIEKIRKLQLGNEFICNIDYNIEKLSIVFPNIEHLRVNHKCSITQIFDFLYRFKHLSSASFQYVSWFSNEEYTQQHLKIKLVLDRIRRLQRINYTYRFDCSSVHIWI